MAILEDISEKYKSHLKCKCEENKCNLNLKGYRKKIILKGEKCVDNGCKICDCLIFIHEKEDILIPIIELKSNSYKAKDVVEKFSNSLEHCEKVLSECSGNDIKFKVFLILLAKSHRSTAEFTKIKDTKIKYKSKKYNIRCKNCGDSLKEIIQLEC